MRRLEDSAKAIDARPFPIHLFALPPRCLRSIIFGVRFDRKRKQELLQQIERVEEFKHVTIRQAATDDQEFQLRIADDG